MKSKLNDYSKINRQKKEEDEENAKSKMLCVFGLK